MKAIIMAGGEGTRLRPITCTVPKPMVKLCGKPAAEYILELLRLHGCDEAVFTLCYKGEQIERYFDSAFYKGIQLGFSYEEEPLGTAGCVKKAADFDEDFIVISGDAMCDFNLTAAMNFHKKVKADATIVTKQVDDPREYGIVLAENGTITGFSEKPSYLSCVCDRANTGVYILSKSALDLIPDKGKSDFARDIFPQMLSGGMKLCCFDENGYWCDIGDIDSYKKCQRDILSGLCKCEIPPNFADEKNYPDAIIRKPCFIGENVTIENGAVIESGSVVESGSVIGAGCKLHGSIVQSGSVIGTRTACNGAVICENVKIGSNCGIYENAVIGSGTVIECSSSVTAAVKIYPQKHIYRGTSVVQDVKYGCARKKELSEKGIAGITNSDISPRFAAEIGCAAGCLGAEQITVACDDNAASQSLKSAVISGITSTGTNACDCGNITLPMLIYCSRILNSQYLVHISAKAETEITILGRNGLPLARSEERKLESGINRGEYKSAPWDRFGKASLFKSSAEIYSAMLNKLADFHSDYKVAANCSNPVLAAIVKPIAERISNPCGEPLSAAFDFQGKKCEINCGYRKYSHETLVSIACADIIGKGFDVAVPYSFPSAVDSVAKNAGRYVHRFFSCSNDNADLNARKIAETEPFLSDGAVLLLTILSSLAERKVTLEKAADLLPLTVSADRFVEINVPPQQILSRISSGSSGIGEGVVVNSDNSRVLLRSDKNGRGIFLYAESFSEETAREMCDKTEKMIKKLMQKKEDKQR